MKREKCFFTHKKKLHKLDFSGDMPNLFTEKLFSSSVTIYSAGFQDGMESKSIVLPLRMRAFPKRESLVRMYAISF